jgi:hypothetical protein
MNAIGLGRRFVGAASGLDDHVRPGGSGSAASIPSTAVDLEERR